MFYITFRMDDITPGMNWKNFNLFCELFARHGLKPLLGVVPNNQDASLNIERNYNRSFWNIISSLQSKGWSIAQHGYTHVYCTNSSGILGINKKSEFAGLSYKSQLHKIRLGKKILIDKGIVSDIWMAPAHSYDLNTIQALYNSGFKFISDGYALFPYVKNGLKFIPCQFSFPKKLFYSGVFTVCIHSNTASSEYIKKLEYFIEKNSNKCISYREALAIEPFNSKLNLFSESVFLNLRKVKSLFN